MEKFVLPNEASAWFNDAGRENFSLSEAWFHLLADTALPTGDEARFETLAEAGQMLGVLPLRLERLRPFGRQARSLTTYYSSLYRPVLATGCSGQRLTNAINELRDKLGLDSVRLDMMDPGHPAFQMIWAALEGAGLKVFSFFCFGNWYLPVNGQAYAEYFAERPSTVRHTVLRRGRQFEAKGRGRLELMLGEDSETAIRLWERIYNASWKEPEPFPGFMPGLIRLCAGQGWLRLGIAYYDNEPIAAQIWIVNNGRASIYKLAYDEAHARHSAGTLLTAFLMRHVLDVDKVTEVDYLVGDEPYKQDWMSHRRERWGIVAYNPRRLAGLYGWAREALGRRVKKWVSDENAADNGSRAR
jgi:hypothetical protein